MVFISEDEKAARAGTYAVRLDPQFWYDEALKRVFDAANEFEVRVYRCRTGNSRRTFQRNHRAYNHRA